ncbi:MAG: DUF3822 family protein [Rikenellaceae bacterium]|jgi:hypothetical protein|nr:DUF3822 family protein [Rikenellaceae bacterium]
MDAPQQQGKSLEKVLTIRIRLAVDGCSFYCSMDKDAVPKDFYPLAEHDTLADMMRRVVGGDGIVPANFVRVEVEVDTDRLILLPNTAYEPGMEEGYLAVNNISYRSDEAVVISPSFGIRAIMIAPRDLVEFLNNQWEGRVSYTSPILESIYRKKRGTLEVNLTRRFAYFTVIEDKLDYAEVFPYEGVPDLLYYLKRLETSYNLQNCTILVMGHQASAVIKKLAGYYRSVIGYAHYQW